MLEIILMFYRVITNVWYLEEKIIQISKFFQFLTLVYSNNSQIKKKLDLSIKSVLNVMFYRKNAVFAARPLYLLRLLYSGLDLSIFGQNI